MIRVPANDAPGVTDELRDSADRLRYSLAQIGKRWADRLILEKCSLAEEYVKGRLNLALDLHFSRGAEGEEHRVVMNGGRAICPNTTVFIGNFLEPYTGNAEDRYDQLVFVDGVELGHRPQAAPAAVVGFQLGNDIVAKTGAGLIYRSYLRAGYKFFFPLVKGEINGRAFHANDSRCRMNKGAAKVVDDISSKQWEICRNVLGSFNLQAVLTGLRIVLYPHAIRLISGDVAPKGVEVSDVYVGPLNL